MIKVFRKFYDILTFRERIYAGALFIFMIFKSLIEVTGVVLVLPFMNLVANPSYVQENQWLKFTYDYLNFQTLRSFLIFAGGIVLTTVVLGSLFRAATRWMTQSYVFGVCHRVSRDLVEKYLNQPYEYFLTHNTADLSSNILTEAGRVTRSFLSPLLQLIASFLVVFFILAVLVSTSPYLSMFVIIFLGGSYGIIYLFVRKKLTRSGKKSTEVNEKRYRMTSEALDGIKEIKLGGHEKYFLEKYSNFSHSFASLRAFNKIVTKVPRYFLEIFAFGGVVTLILYYIVIGEGLKTFLPLASMYAFAAYKIMPALQRVFNAMTKIRFYSPVLDKLHKEGIKKNRQTKSPDFISVEPLPFENKIELASVTYYYPETEQPVIENLDLSISKGSSVTFAGETGAGKTTLVNIILGLLYPVRGRLLVDETPVNEDNVLNWRRNIGYVPQQVYLLDDSVRANVAFGLPPSQKDQGRIEKAVKIANIKSFIEDELEDGYDTRVGERGVRLSGGQIKRLGIARALYHDPEVLVLDEATSDLDTVTEKSVMGAIKNVSGSKTLLMIAHRLSTVENCDVIHFLENGKIVNSGSYMKLVEECSSFREMTNLTS